MLRTLKNILSENFAFFFENLLGEKIFKLQFQKERLYSFSSPQACLTSKETSPPLPTQPPKRIFLEKQYQKSGAGKISKVGKII